MTIVYIFFLIFVIMSFYILKKVRKQEFDLRLLKSDFVYVEDRVGKRLKNMYQQDIDKIIRDIEDAKEKIKSIEEKYRNSKGDYHPCSFINGAEYNNIVNAINGIMTFFKDNNVYNVVSNYSVIVGELERLKYDIHSLMNDLGKAKSDISRFEYFENDFRNTKKYFSEQLIETNKKVRNIEEIIVILDSNISFLKKTIVILQGIRKNRSELEKLIGNLNEKREKLKEEFYIDEKR